MIINTHRLTGPIVAILLPLIVALLSQGCHSLLVPSPPPSQSALRLQPQQQLDAVRPFATTLSRPYYSKATTAVRPFSTSHATNNGPFNKIVTHRRRGKSVTTTAIHSSASDSTNENNATEKDEETPLPLAMAVGIITSLVGYAYSKMMKIGFRFFWKTLPSAVLFDGGTTSSNGGIFHGLRSLLIRYPQAYIVLVMTFGAFTVGTLSTCYFPKMFSAHDYVDILSEEGNEEESGNNKMDQFPRARESYLPILLLSCLTSVTGFSLGPEAPMVCAGGLAGVSIARKYSQYISNKSKSSNLGKKSSQSLEETLAYAGAAGTLTGFMNVPLAGPIFAMEMTSRKAGLSASAARSWSATMAASLAGMVFVRGGLCDAMNVGGHFTYAAKAGVGVVTGREMALAGLGCGVGGALVGTCFHKTTHLIKSILWPEKKASSSSSAKREQYISILKKTLVGFAIGLLSTKFPQTMFWGEGSLQCMVDGQCTPFSVTPHAIPSVMTQFARVNPNIPFSTQNSPLTAALQVGIAKFFAIALASAGRFPGGVIFPLLSNGASLSHGLVSALGSVAPFASSSLAVPMIVMSFMAATLTSITRTPLATVLILALTASGQTPLSALLPGVLLASYISVWVSERLSKESFFSYAD